MGKPHVFVRFGNCNLRCEWCDTNFLDYEEMELQDIVKQVLSYGCERVMFTGGEPCLQDLETIGNELKKLYVTLTSIYVLAYQSNGIELRTPNKYACSFSFPLVQIK